MDESKLIELVREHPPIYNPQHQQYKDSNVATVYDEIADIIKIPVVKTGIFFSVEECKNRWKNILDTYMRHIKEKKKLPTRSSRSKKFCKWHLKDMLCS